MLGEQIGETTGKRSVRRVISTDPPTVEVSFEDSGYLFGVATTGMGTYTSVIRPDGSIYGEGEGINMTQEGEGITWTGMGVGKFGPAAQSATVACCFSKLIPRRSPWAPVAALSNTK
jgi:hypothetical protein